MCSQDDVVKHLVEQGAQVDCKDENDVCIVHGPRTYSSEVHFCISRVLVQSHDHVLLKGLRLVCCVVLKNVGMFCVDFLYLFFVCLVVCLFLL